ncbi:MAG: hypothetical protein C7B45_15410, partial [Sulfobacillus acidophilus]
YRQVHAALQWEHAEVQVAPISVYRVLNRHGLLGPRMSAQPPHKRRPWVRFERAKPHELWQVDVSYWYIEGWGYYYLHTILDDHSRYVIRSRFYRTYGAVDGIHLLEEALAAVPAADRVGLQLLADHGVTYTAAAFQQACQEAQIALIFASVAHPQTKGKLERWHLVAEKLTPPEPTRGTLLYWRGGGYCMGSAATHRESAGRLARATRTHVWIPECQLAPEHRDAVALNDAGTVYRALLEQGIFQEQLIMGGGLAAALVALRGQGLPMPRGVILLSPWTDSAARCKPAPHVIRGWTRIVFARRRGFTSTGTISKVR